MTEEEVIKDLISAINAAVRWFEEESEDWGGAQRWQVEANTGGKTVYLKLKKAAFAALEKGVD